MAEHRSPLFVRTTVAVGALALLASSSACHDDAQRAADQRAHEIQASADHRADQLRAQADQVERNARDEANAQADALRRQANTVHEQGENAANDTRETADRAARTAGTTVDTAPSDTRVVVARGGGPAVTNAMSTYAEAMCDHAQQCNSIGVGHHWRDRAACLADQRNDRSHSWETSHECAANGVNQAHLDACLGSVRDDHCGNPIDSLGHMAACRAAEVCGR